MTNETTMVNAVIECFYLRVCEIIRNRSAIPAEANRVFTPCFNGVFSFLYAYLCSKNYTYLKFGGGVMTPLTPPLDPPLTDGKIMFIIKTIFAVTTSLRN